MMPLFAIDGDLPQGMHQRTWTAFRERFCIFAHSDRRLRLCRQIEQMLEEAQASQYHLKNRGLKAHALER